MTSSAGSARRGGNERSAHNCGRAARRVEYRRAVVTDQGLGGRSMSVPIVASASTGTWRVIAYTDPKRPPVGETTFMVEDYVADRIEFDITSAAKGISRAAPAQLSVDGHFLMGRPLRFSNSPAR